MSDHTVIKVDDRDPSHSSMRDDGQAIVIPQSHMQSGAVVVSTPVTGIPGSGVQMPVHVQHHHQLLHSGTNGIPATVTSSGVNVLPSQHEGHPENLSIIVYAPPHQNHHHHHHHQQQHPQQHPHQSPQQHPQLMHAPHMPPQPQQPYGVATTRTSPFVQDLHQSHRLGPQHPQVHGGLGPMPGSSAGMVPVNQPPHGMSPVINTSKSAQLQSNRGKGTGGTQPTKRFPCNLCSRSFMHKQSLDIHMRSHTGERPYSCNDCGQSFSQRATLNRHRRRVHLPKSQQCLECGRKFGCRDYLIKHLRTHTGELPYNCPKCNKRFRDKSALNQHSRSHK